MMEQDVTGDLENGETNVNNYPWPYLSKFMSLKKNRQVKVTLFYAIFANQSLKRCRLRLYVEDLKHKFKNAHTGQ